MEETRISKHLLACQYVLAYFAPMDIRERILTAAAKVYSEVGFRGATTRRIAEEADVNEVTIFRQFGSKAVLLHEAIHHELHTPQPPPLPSEPGDPRTDLTVWSRGHHANLVAKRSLIRTCFGECEEHPSILPPSDNAARRSGAVLCQYLQTLQARGVIRSDLRLGTASKMLTGVLFADAMIRDVMPDLFPMAIEPSIAEYVDLFLRAIVAPESS